MISIIVTNFNKGDFIKKTLESCRNQLDKNFEIIFFDDSSTDNSLKIVNNFIKKNKQIKFKLIKRKGRKNFNNCYNQISAIINSIKYTSGEYISLLDADDIFSKTKLKILNNKIKKTKKKVIYNSYFILKNKKYLSNKRHFYIRRFIWPIFPPTSCITIEKKLFEKVLKKVSFKKFPSCWLDFRLAIYLSKHHKSEILYLKENLTTYRKNEDGIDNIYTNIFSVYYWIRKFEALVLNLKI
jgi:glycosyltransferase involved in cell wall biosynthesis